MKIFSVISLFAFLLCAPAGPAQSGPQRSFDILKGLAGKWRGKDTLGHPVEVSFRVTSKESAIVNEYVEPDQKEDMISMIHMDGNRVLLTHYCSAGNQPRMAASLSADGRTITFDFVDATNLPSLNAGHMRRLVITILDPDHHTEEWTYIDGGKDLAVLADLRRAHQ